MTNFLPTLTSKLPSVMQATAVDSLSVVTGITQEELTAAVDAAVKSSTEAINGDMGMLWMLLSGILVFFMQAGFTLVESGMTRSKNAVNIAMKNLLDICVGSLTYWIIGYSLMYGDTSNGWFFWSGLFQGEGADLFFQTMFAATAATIVSGAIAGRTKYSTYVIFSIVMTAIIYPISGGWQWQGSGWLTELGFIDFAGSSIVHSVGGWAALVAAILVGPRIGKFLDGKVMPIPGHNQVLATLGVFILWLGWFGFNGGSQLAWGGADAIGASNVVLITNLAAAAGGLGALITTWIWYGKPHLAQTLNGALAGLVSITAGCGNMSSEGAALAGLIGGVLVVFSIEFIEKLDDKFDSAIGEDGVTLSGGQRQRLSIARAIAKDSPILILDEATSALDSATEKLVQSAINKMQKDRTTIIIAHRLSTIQNADRIIVLKDGEIIEQGTHAELIKASGEYEKLNQQQL